MKKKFFVKKYPIYGDFDVRATQLTPTIEVDFDEIEKSLPFGSEIRKETIQTVIVGDEFVVYGEYSSLESTLKAAAAVESIDIDEVLGETGPLPSVN